MPSAHEPASATLAHVPAWPCFSAPSSHALSSLPSNGCPSSASTAFFASSALAYFTTTLSSAEPSCSIESSGPNVLSRNLSSEDAPAFRRSLKTKERRLDMWMTGVCGGADEVGDGWADVDAIGDCDVAV